MGNMKTYKNIDIYIKAQPESIQGKLREMYEIIKNTEGQRVN